MASPILLVADDLSLIAAVKRTLAREGQECRLATSAADAIIAFGHELPALVLLQPDVESGRGEVLLEELRAHPEAALLKVVLLGAGLPGQDLPVEPLPIEGRHLLQTIEAHRRGASEALPSSARKTLPPLGAEVPGASPPASARKTWPPEGGPEAPPPSSTRRTWPPPEGEADAGGEPSSPASTRRTWPPPAGEGAPGLGGSSPSSARRAWPPRQGEPAASSPSGRRPWPPRAGEASPSSAGRRTPARGVEGAGLASRRTPVPGSEAAGASARQTPLPGSEGSGASARRTPVPGSEAAGASARQTPFPGSEGGGASARRTPIPASEVAGASARQTPLPGSGGSGASARRTPVTEGEAAGASPDSTRRTWPPPGSEVDTWPGGGPRPDDDTLPSVLRGQDLSLLDTARVPGGALGASPRVSPAPAEAAPPEHGDTQRFGAPARPAPPAETLREWASFSSHGASSLGLEEPTPAEESGPPAPLEPTVLRRAPRGPADTADDEPPPPETSLPPPTAPTAAPPPSPAAPSRRRLTTAPLFPATAATAPSPPPAAEDAAVVAAPTAPSPAATGPGAAGLAVDLFGDLPALEDEVHRDVEAQALATLEASLPPGPAHLAGLPARVQAALSRAEALAGEGRGQARARREDLAARLVAAEQALRQATARAEAAEGHLRGEQEGRTSTLAQLQQRARQLEAELAEERAAHARGVDAARAHADVRVTQREQTLSEEAASWHQRLEAAEAALAQAHGSAEQLGAQLRERDEKLAEVVRRRDEKVAELTRQREERLADLNRAQAEAISALTRRHDEKAAELRRHLAEAQAAAEIARSEASSSSDSVSRLEAEQRAHDATRRALAEAEAHRSQLESENTLVEEAREEAELARQAADEAVEQAEAARAAAAGQVAGLQAELAIAREFVEEAGQQRQALEGEVAGLRASLVEARSSLAAQEQEKASLREELDRAAGRQASAVKELTQAKDALDQARTRAEQAEATVALAYQKLEEQDRRNTVTLALPGKRPLGVPRHGEVDLAGLAQLVCQLVLARADAGLELGALGGQRTLWLQGGQLVAATSSFPGEGLIERARQDGLIDGRQEAELRLVKSGTVREQLEALKGRRMIREVEAVPLVQRHAEHLALQALSEPQAQYRLSDQPPGPEVTLVTIPRSTLPLLAEALRRAVDPETLLERLGGGEAVPTATDADLDLRSLGFSDRERRMLGKVDGEAPVEALALESGLRAEVAFRALVVAQLLGLLVLKVPEGPRAPLDPELDARRLLAKYDQVVDADYFSILGLPRTAGADEVRRAFERLREEFHPLRFSGHPDVGIQERAHQVSRFLEEAAQALEDDERRAEYARHLLD